MTAAKLLEEALRLPPKARANLAGDLILSLDRGTDSDAEESWNREIDRRLDRFEKDKVSAVDWSQVKAMIMKARGARKHS